MIWKIAIRNLLQHKTKTLIVGTLVAIGITLTLAGNSVIDSMISMISKSFVRNYTGDILVTSTETAGAGVFGSQSDDMMGPPLVPRLKDYEAARGIVRSHPGVHAVASQLTAYAAINLEEKGSDWGCFFGIDPADYFAAMDGARIFGGLGRRLGPGEEGVMLHRVVWKRIKDKLGVELKPGDPIRLNSFGNVGVRIREVPLVGVFEFDSGNDRLYVPSFADIRTLRYLAGRNESAAAADVGETASAYLDSDIDSLFGDTEAVVSGKADRPPEDPFGILGPKAAPAPAPASADGDWNFVLARVDEGADPDAIIESLNATFDDLGLRARAQGWWVSAMPDSLTYSGVQLLFNAFIFVLALVSVIVIMNTLVASVMERTAEIGTMRALGASRSTVLRMFVAETSFLTVAFGLLGVAAGAAIVGLLGAGGIPTDNDALRFLGGGVVLRPVVGAGPLAISFGLMAFIGLVSWIFPVLLALKVSPLRAIAAE